MTIAPTKQVVQIGEKTATVAVDEYRNEMYLSLRFMYRDGRDELQYGKNGINVLLEDSLEAITAMLEIYNLHMGTHLVIVDGPELVEE